MRWHLRIRLFKRRCKPNRIDRRILFWKAGACLIKAARVCRDLLTHWDALWRFSRGEGIEPTNNIADRAIRGGGGTKCISEVASLSGCCQSARFVCSKAATCSCSKRTRFRQRGRDKLHRLFITTPERLLIPSFCAGSSASNVGKGEQLPFSLASCRICAARLTLFLNCHAQQAGQLNRLNGCNDRALKLLDPDLHAGDRRAAQIGACELGIA
jgi:hypothetical protein